MSCKCEHTITRDGTGQLDRYLKALDPDYAPIDGRDIKELLVYAKRYAGQIRFYDLPDHLVSDGTPTHKISWREFFSKDISVIAASIGTIDLAQIKKDYDETRTNVESNPNAALFAALADPIIGIAARLESWLELVTTTNPVYGDMMLAINSSLRTQLQKLKAMDEGYVVVDAGADLEIDYSQIKNLALWGLDGPIDPDLSVYEGADDESKIRYAALYMDDIFLAFYGYLSGLVERSEGYLLASLDNYPSHQPHMALFIAFLKLFGMVQEQMNGITERMLNFYYRDVLQLQEKPSIPDKVHIIFELAKGVTAYSVKKETELDGGKDTAGLDQIYQTDDEIVVNQSKVAELKTLFIEKALSPHGFPAIKEIYARPVANSIDGYGEPFEDPYPVWPTFGERRKDTTSYKNICDEIEGLKEDFHFKNEAAIGFAIASPQLVLQGGSRIINFKLKGIKKLLAYNSEDRRIQIQIKLTTTEGWLIVTTILSEPQIDALKAAISTKKFESENLPLSSGYYLTENDNEDELTIFLPTGELPIVGYMNDVHKGSFTTTHPVMQVLLGPAIMTREDDFKSLNFKLSSLFVKVGSINTIDGEESPNMDGLRVLNLENDTGIIDRDKVFDPFTAYPNMGKSLYIGSNEIFNKPLKSLSVNIEASVPIVPPVTEFEVSPIGLNEAKYKLNLRYNGRWQPQTKGDEVVDFGNSELTANVILEDGVEYTTSREPIKNYSAYSSTINKGYMELQLNTPTSRSTAKLLQEEQNSAEYLKAKGISLSYESTLDKLDSNVDQVFHVYPFGVVETYIDLIDYGDNDQVNGSQILPIQSLKRFNEFDAARDNLVVNINHLLLPQFSYADANTVVAGKANEGLDESRYKNNRQDNSRSLLQQTALLANGLYNTVGVSANQYSGAIQEEGLLYIGLENLKPQQTITLLFQFAEGSAEDTDNDPPEIHWSYLSNNEWKPLNDINIISDGTYGFQTTGIVKIDIPKDATDNNTIITKGLHWFRTSVTENSHRIPKLVDVVAQAVVAKFDDRDNDPSHFECPLPAESIGKLLINKAEVKSVAQPFASWNGKAKEIGQEFYVRVSERLRHKARAITAWDYEHLVLNRYPNIYKVKAITHTDPNCLCRTNVLANTPESITTVTFDANFELIIAEDVKDRLLSQRTTLTVAITVFVPIAIVDDAIVDRFVDKGKGPYESFSEKGFKTEEVAVVREPDGEPRIEIRLYGAEPIGKSCCGPQIAPGHVMLVPISSFKSRNAIDPLRPKTSRKTLLEIEDYLKKRTSPFVKVHAKNPVYEQVMVFFCVKFYLGLDKGFYLKQLNEEIVQYLTPWAFDAGADIQFDQKIYASSIINFIEERPYVDYIKDFLMGVCKDECCSEPVRLEDIERAGSGEDGTDVRGIIFDGDTGIEIEGANVHVLVEDAIIHAHSDNFGEFNLELDPNAAVVARIFLEGYETKLKHFKNDTFWTIYLYKIRLDGADRASIDHDDKTPKERFTGLCGCTDVENLLADAEFEGETVIKPSTNRSLLVSAPKHLIVSCKEEPVLDPCAERKSKLQQAGTETMEQLSSGTQIVGSASAVMGVLKPKTQVVQLKDSTKATVTAKKKEDHKSTSTTKAASKGKTATKAGSTKQAVSSKSSASASATKATSAAKKPVAKKTVVKKTTVQPDAQNITTAKKASAKKSAGKTVTKKRLPKQDKPKK